MEGPILLALPQPALRCGTQATTTPKTGPNLADGQQVSRQTSSPCEVLRRPSATGPLLTHPAHQQNRDPQPNDMMLARFQQSFWVDQNPNWQT